MWSEKRNMYRLDYVMYRKYMVMENKFFVCKPVLVIEFANEKKYLVIR